MSNWVCLPASDFCLSVRDGTHDSPKPVQIGKKLITSRHMISGTLDLENAYLISQVDFDEVNRRSKVDQWDVLISMIGTVGEVYLEKEEPAYAIKNIGLFKSRSEQHGRWLYYYLKSPDARTEMKARGRGTTQPYVPLGELRSFPIKFPAEDAERDSIIAILGALDDKIDLNRRMNETLEAMARAIFKDWFVDFGPTRAKMESCEPYLAPELWALFPDRLDDEGTPGGWEKQALSEFFSIIGGGTPKTSTDAYWGGKIPWFSVVDTPAKGDVYVLNTEKTITQLGLDESSARMVPAGTTIISARGTVGNLAVAGRDMTFNQSCYALRGVGAVGDCFVYLAAQHLVSQLQSMAHGSVFSTITRQTFEAVSLPMPGKQTFSDFEAVAGPWFAKIKANVEESRTLAQIRDLLLPKLMSGEIRVGETKQ